MNLRLRRQTCVRLAAALAITAVPVLGLAESNFVANAAGLSTTAHLDFQITIPQMLFLQVGAGSAPLFNNNPTISLIEFDVPASRLADGSAVGATPASGDLGNGQVSVRLRGNTGDVQLRVDTAGELTRAGGTETIAWNDIAIQSAAAAGSPQGPIAHPLWSGGSITIPAINSTVDLQAVWTYSYNNARLLRAGQYGGIGVNNGRVTYTATQP